MHKLQMAEWLEVDDGDIAARAAARDLADQTFDKRVVEVLGADIAKQFQMYRESLVSRAEVDGLAENLESASLPLSEEQRRRLKQWVVADYQRLPNPMFHPVAGQPIESTRNAMVHWNRDRSVRFEDSLRTFLSDEQHQFIEDSRSADKEGHAW